jgi:hypothetical protein
VKISGGCIQRARQRPIQGKTNFPEGIMHGDFYNLFVGYWWLLFPLGFAIAGAVRVWLQHLQARDRLALIKSYVDQGKEPPPELLRVLEKPVQQREEQDRKSHDWSQHYVHVGFLFATLAAAFTVMCSMKFHEGDGDTNTGLVFVSVLMAGFAVSFFATGWIAARNKNRLPPP